MNAAASKLVGTFPWEGESHNEASWARDYVSRTPIAPRCCEGAPNDGNCPAGVSGSQTSEGADGRASKGGRVRGYRILRDRRPMSLLLLDAELGGLWPCGSGGRVRA